VVDAVEHKGRKGFEIDVKSAFLNVVLQEEIFVELPKGFVVQGKEDKVYLLKKKGLLWPKTSTEGLVQ